MRLISWCVSRSRRRIRGNLRVRFAGVAITARQNRLLSACDSPNSADERRLAGVVAAVPDSHPTDVEALARCPGPDALDRIAHPVEERERVKITSSSSRVAAARLSCCRAGLTVRFAQRQPANNNGDHIRKASPSQSGKTTTQGIPSSRVEAACRINRPRTRWNRYSVCGNAVEFVDICGLQRKTRSD